jgi:hypothetical protein
VPLVSLTATATLRVRRVMAAAAQWRAPRPFATDTFSADASI